MTGSHARWQSRVNLLRLLVLVGLAAVVIGVWQQSPHTTHAATNLTVDTLANDYDPGVGCTGVVNGFADGDCTLKEAILRANSGGIDTITFSVDGTINLTAGTDSLGAPCAPVNNCPLPTITEANLAINSAGHSIRLFGGSPAIVTRGFEYVPTLAGADFSVIGDTVSPFEFSGFIGNAITVGPVAINLGELKFTHVKTSNIGGDGINVAANNALLVDVEDSNIQAADDGVRSTLNVSPQPENDSFSVLRSTVNGDSDGSGDGYGVRADFNGTKGPPNGHAINVNVNDNVQLSGANGTGGLGSGDAAVRIGYCNAAGCDAIQSTINVNILRNAIVTGGEGVQVFLEANNVSGLSDEDTFTVHVDANGSITGTNGPAVESELAICCGTSDSHSTITVDNTTGPITGAGDGLDFGPSVCCGANNTSLVSASGNQSITGNGGAGVFVNAEVGDGNTLTNTVHVDNNHGDIAGNDAGVDINAETDGVDFNTGNVTVDGNQKINGGDRAVTVFAMVGTDGSTDNASSTVSVSGNHGEIAGGSDDGVHVRNHAGVFGGDSHNSATTRVNNNAGAITGASSGASTGATNGADGVFVRNHAGTDAGFNTVLAEVKGNAGEIRSKATSLGSNQNDGVDVENFADGTGQNAATTDISQNYDILSGQTDTVSNHGVRVAQQAGTDVNGSGNTANVWLNDDGDIKSRQSAAGNGGGAGVHIENNACCVNSNNANVTIDGGAITPTHDDIVSEEGKDGISIENLAGVTTNGGSNHATTIIKHVHRIYSEDAKGVEVNAQAGGSGTGTSNTTSTTISENGIIRSCSGGTSADCPNGGSNTNEDAIHVEVDVCCNSTSDSNTVQIDHNKNIDSTGNDGIEIQFNNNILPNNAITNNVTIVDNPLAIHGGPDSTDDGLTIDSESNAETLATISNNGDTTAFTGGFSGSGGHGIKIKDGDWSVGGVDSQISHNVVSGNASSGIELGGSTSNVHIGPGNVIIGNGSGTGIHIEGNGDGNTITQNRIFNNQGLGIDLDDGSGLDVVGCVPGDTPNDCIPYPDSFSFVSNKIAGHTCPNCTIEFFLVTSGDGSVLADPSGHGEGWKYLGDVLSVGSVDANNQGVFSLVLPCGLLPNQVLTATATDNDGNTSEFSGNVSLGAKGTGSCATNTPTVTNTPSVTNTPTITNTPGTPTATRTPSNTPTITATRTPSNTPTITSTSTSTSTPTVTSTGTIPTSTPTNTATNTPTNTNTPVPPTNTNTPVPPTNTPTNTATRTPTRTPVTPTKACGDVNDDGSVNSVDAALILQLEAGLIHSLRNAPSGDVNGDGHVNSVDAALILQFEARQLTHLSCGSGSGGGGGGAIDALLALERAGGR